MRLKDDVRLLLRNGDRSSMDYIRELKKNRFIKSFFKGYVTVSATEEVSRGNVEGSALMKWDPHRASKAAGY